MDMEAWFLIGISGFFSKNKYTLSVAKNFFLFSRSLQEALIKFLEFIGIAAVEAAFSTLE